MSTDHIQTPGRESLRIRFHRGRYLDCSFCGGRGCLACPGEARKAVASGHLTADFTLPQRDLREVFDNSVFGAIFRAWQAEQDALPEHKRGRPRFDEKTRVYRDCPLCDGEGCEKCPEEAEKEYRRQFPNGVDSALVCSVDRGTGAVTFPDHA